MTVAEDLADVAEELIKEFGREVVLRNPARAVAADPAKPWRVGDETAPANDTVHAVFVAQLGKPVDGTLVHSETGPVLVAAKATIEAPTTEHVLLDGTIQYSIVSVETIKPGPIAIIYELLVKR